MANLVTELEIKKYQGMDKVVLPVGTILTPAARDWAMEHQLTITYNDGGGENPALKVDETEKAAILRQIIKTVVKVLQQNGISIKREELAPLIIACLERLGCRVIS